MPRRPPFAAALALLLALAGCGSTNPSPLKGRWSVELIDGQPLREGAKATVTITGNGSTFIDTHENAALSRQLETARLAESIRDFRGPESAEGDAGRLPMAFRVGSQVTVENLDHRVRLRKVAD